MSDLQAQQEPKDVITVSLAHTANLGNFESIKVNIGLTSDRRVGETPSQAFDRVYSFVEKRLEEKIKEIRA